MRGRPQGSSFPLICGGGTEKHPFPAAGGAAGQSLFVRRSRAGGMWQ